MRGAPIRGNFGEKSAKLVNPSPNATIRALQLDHLDDIKLAKVYSEWLTVTLSSGSVARVERLDIFRTYLGWINGVPPAGDTAREIESAREFCRSNFGGPEPVVIPPKLYDALSDKPILPPLRFVAQISSNERLVDDSYGSWMNLIWFAEIDAERPLIAFVNEALSQVDWKTQASSYDCD